MPILELDESSLSTLSDIDTTDFKAEAYPFPDFLIVGPQRTGSSWLRTNLCKHPQVFMPFEKEIFFFSHLRRKDHRRYKSDRLEYYSNLFRIRPAKKLERFAKAACHGLFNPPTIRGEATASYATMPERDIGNIFSIYPGIRIVIIVRNPIQRSFSHAKKALVRDRKRDFDAVPFEDFEHYYTSQSNLARGTYSKIIDLWWGFAQPDAVFVADYKKLDANPLQFLTEIQDFLGIASGPRFARKHLHTIVNPTGSKQIPHRHADLLSGLFSAELALLESRYGIKF
jgi:hypothetical protein